uniref:Protein AF1q n=1 Tax=Sciurus vulgaris TaxID=55149 RepID=A0A8D2DT55_SCIVU
MINKISWVFTSNSLITENFEGPFLFWRMLIPELELSELEGLGLSDTPTCKIKDSSIGKMRGQATGGVQEKTPENGLGLREYSTFNFWKAPTASTHSFNLL